MKNISAGLVAATLAGVLLSLPQTAFSQTPPSSSNASAQTGDTAGGSAETGSVRYSWRSSSLRVKEAQK